MVEVITMPPVGYTAIGQGLENPRSASTTISGAPRYSQTREARRQFGLTIHGIGTDLAGQGYIEQLRRRLNGQAPIVLLQVRPDGWHLAMDRAVAARGHGPLTWTYGGDVMKWTYQANSLTWWYSSTTVTAGTDYGGDYLDVTGLKVNSVIAYPGEKVVQGSTVGRVVGISRTDASGDARIYVDTTFTSGIVQISPKEWVYASINSMPLATQPAGQGYTYDWSMTEVLPQDFDSFELVQPWRSL